MSKIARETQELFGTGGGTTDFTEFGATAAGYPSVPTFYSGSTITPALVQALSQFVTGWRGAIVSGNAPTIQDMNSIFFLAFYQLTYLFQQGIAEYDSGTTYFAGSVVTYSAAQYVCINDASGAGISGETPTNGTYWSALGGAVQTKSANYSMLATDKMVVVSGGHAVTLPDATTVMGRDFEVVAGDANSSNSVKTVSSQTISGQNATSSPYAIVEQYQFVKVRSDGSNYWIVSAG